MPTFKNNTDVNIKVTNIAGNSYQLAPGESFETFNFDVDSNLTQIDEDPLRNMTTEYSAVTLQSDIENVTALYILQPETKSILIHTITDSCVARPQTKTAKPMLMATSASPAIWLDIDDKFVCDRIYLTGSGTCFIWEVDE